MRYVRIRLTADGDEEIIEDADEFWVTDRGELAVAGTRDGEVLTIAQFASYYSAVLEEDPDADYESTEALELPVRSPLERLAELDASAAALGDVDDDDEQVALDVPEPSANGHVPVDAVPDDVEAV